MRRSSNNVSGFKQNDPRRNTSPPECQPPPLPRRPQAQVPIAPPLPVHAQEPVPPPEEVYRYEPLYGKKKDDDYDDISNEREDCEDVNDQNRDSETSDNGYQIPQYQMEDYRSYNDRSRFLYEDNPFEINLLLIGKTGQGKSALGNSILWRQAFEHKQSFTSVTKLFSEEVVEYKDKVVTVFDGPGVIDTDMNEEMTKNKFVELLSEAITINLTGYHAFLLVVKFGERFTRESCLTIEVLKSVFGENFVKRFCILVLTFGDLFQEHSFRDWLSEQTGDMMKLVQECGNRVILYDSITKEKAKRAGQLDALLDMVQKLALKNGRYTSEQFDLAKLSRDALSVEPKKLLIEEDIMKKASLILNSLQSFQIDATFIDDPYKYRKLDELKSQAASLLDQLKKEDKNTGVLQEMINHVQSLRSTIEDEIRLLKRLSQRMKVVSPENKAALTVRIRRRKKDLYQNHVEGRGQSREPEKVNSQTFPELSREDLEDIYNMDKQWKKTIQLDNELKEMKRKKKSNILVALQRKVLAVLKGNMKNGRRSVDKTEIQAPVEEEAFLW